jgi:hypothetical protein
VSVRSSQAVTVDFTTRSPTTGALANADSLPAGTLVVNGTDNGAAVTVTNKATGVYKAAVTLPTLAVGDEVQLRVNATVGGVADGDYVWGDVCDVSLDSSGRLLLQPTQTGVTIPTVTTLTNLPAIPANWITAAGIATDAITAAKIAADAVGASELAADAVTEIAAGVWNALRATYDALGSMGEEMNQLNSWVTAVLATSDDIAGVNTNVGAVAGQVWDLAASGHATVGTFGALAASRSVRNGTLQTGSTSTTAKLDAGASATDNFYRNCGVLLTGGTGAGQYRLVRSYAGSTRVATVNRAWAATPDATTTFAVLPRESVWEEETADHAAAGTFGAGVELDLAQVVSGVWAQTQVGGILGGLVGMPDSAWSVSTRTLTAFGFTVSTNANATEIKAKTDNLPASPAAVGSVMALDTTQVVPAANVTAHSTVTVGDALLAARAQGAGAWTLSGTTLTLKNPDGTTFRVFTLDSATAPTSRT